MFFFLNDTATTEIYTLSLHDALPILVDTSGRGKFLARRMGLTRESPIRHGAHFFWVDGLLNVEKLTSLSPQQIRTRRDRDRKSTRLNSSHGYISYAVFCLKETKSISC